jgi:hypothetical protein
MHLFLVGNEKCLNNCDELLKWDYHGETKYVRFAGKNVRLQAHSRIVALRGCVKLKWIDIVVELTQPSYIQA